MSIPVMRIDASKTNSQGHSVEVEFQVNRKHFQIFFRSNDAILTGNNEAYIASALLPAMVSGVERLSLKGEVSERFFTALTGIQGLYCSWYPKLHPLSIEHLTVVSKPPVINKRVASFFSGGVDSFYTLLKHQDEITDIILVHGFDMRLGDTLLRHQVSAKIREVANHFGKNVIEVETNLRKLLDPYVDWGELGHGPGLVTIAHLLSAHFQRIYIPSSLSTIEGFVLYGSHPDLDPLWRTETLEFIHDGCEALRHEKIEVIANHDIVLQNLRVCWENPHSLYNCGHCEKCLRTMIALKAYGQLNRCTTFAKPLEIKGVLEMEVKEFLRPYIKNNLELLEEKQGDEELIKALQQILNKPQWALKLKHRVKKLLRSLKMRFLRHF